MKPFEYYNPEHLIFGCGTFNQLATLPMPGKKACIVCTPSRRYVDRAIELLAQNGVECVVYDKCRQNPDTTTIGNGAKFAYEQGVDFLVSIGGGSTTDTAKCMGVLLDNGVNDNIWDYVAYYEGHKEPKSMMPLVIVSTTSGTGTEADQSGVLTEEFKNIKLDVAYPCMWSVYSIVDPELQTSVPPFYTACQGMDVIFHSSESYLDKYHTPYTDICERNTFISCGSSSSLLLRRNSPKLKILELFTRYLLSLESSSVICMERNFSIVNAFPFRPTRSLL